MRVLFIGVYADDETISYINKSSKNEGSVSVAAIKYTRLIGEGIKQDIGKKCTNLFLVPIGMFPTSKLIFWFPRKKAGNYYIPFLNILVIKQIMIASYLFCFSFYWCFKNRGKENKYIIFSFIYLPFLIGVAPLKILKNVFITTFVPDMPEFEFSYSKSDFSLKKFLVPIYIYLSKKIISITDYFVFITKFMVDCYSKRPYSIIEGFTDSKMIEEEEVIYSEKKAIMYAGALFEKFGVKLLINAFINIPGDYELWLFGNGDMENEIKKFVEVDSRIKYFGNRPNNEILEFEKRAKLLVNPRFTTNEFTKFSFPSKLIEYMASGTPVLTTRLLGIPNDYREKMFYIEEETVHGLKNSILMCFSKSQEELDLFGNNAKSYVLINKNNLIQIKELLKIMNLKLSK
jgi:glycosyltransferase involved in cell wall biosynthesis